MAKNKRNKIVPLSKVTKKAVSERKVKLVEKIHKLLTKYKYCFVFSYKNMTNLPMIALREYFSDSVFLIGKNKVIQVALGRDQESEPKENSLQLCQYLKGNCGLFFTSRDSDEVIKYFEEYNCPYFGNVGTVATETIVLNRGLDERLNGFPSSMESQFRQLGLKVKLDNGKFCLLEDYTICSEGKELTVEQAKMVKHLGIVIDKFFIKMLAFLGDNGQFEVVNKTE